MRGTDLNGNLLLLASFAFIASGWTSDFVMIAYLQVLEFLTVVVLGGMSAFVVALMAVLQSRRRCFSKDAFAASMVFLLRHALLANLLMLLAWSVQGGAGWQ